MAQQNTLKGELEVQQTSRSEVEIFSDLSRLCSKTGFAHAIAYFCFRDNIIRYQEGERLTSDDLMNLHSSDRLIRNEISTLIGLLFKQPIDLTLPEPHIMQDYINDTDKLLVELHHSMMISSIDTDDLKSGDFNSLSKGTFLREQIFYSCDSAYHFQYKELSVKKYLNDDPWFKRYKGYSILDLEAVFDGIGEVQPDKIESTHSEMQFKDPSEWSILPGFIFTIDDVSTKSGIDAETVRTVIDSFVAPSGNEGFNSMSDFNVTSAYPIIWLGNSQYLLFQHYSLQEALYETPFYWFYDDISYRSKAMQHRGEFTEKFSTERLTLVFGENRVLSNIDIVDSSGNKAGEIDTLVVFADRAIVVQAKSKKLTIESRKGNDQSIQDDFRKSIQDSYSQGLNCSNLLLDNSFKLYDSERNEVKISRTFTEVYIFCVVSDHYPSLSSQVQQFLKYETTDVIMPPVVMDVFFLDVFTEMLQSPLRFLSYIKRRSGYFSKLRASNELIILAYHLTQNLWVDSEYTGIYLADDISSELDVAMMVRRLGVEGNAIPEGILTRYQNTIIGRLLSDIESIEEPKIIDFGIMILTLGDTAIEQLNEGIKYISSLSLSDGRNHDFSLGFDSEGTGITVHSNQDLNEVAIPRLQSHCDIRKYREKTDHWFGICINPNDFQLRFGINVKGEWVRSDAQDAFVADLPEPQLLSKRKGLVNFTTKIRGRKVGRNESCPCGSNRKYKKCCL